MRLSSILACLYSVVNRRRVGFAITSTSEVDNGITSIVPIINSLPALYTKLWEGKCLTLFMVKIRLTPSKRLY